MAGMRFVRNSLRQITDYCKRASHTLELWRECASSRAQQGHRDTSLPMSGLTVCALLRRRYGYMPQCLRDWQFWLPEHSPWRRDETDYVIQPVAMKTCRLKIEE